MRRKSNTLRNVILFFSILFVSIGIWKNWREFNYRKTCITMKAKVIDAHITTFSGKGMASVRYKVTYMHNAKIDTLTVFSSLEISTKNPIPTVEELKKHPIYVHYVPIEKKSKTAFSDRISTTTDGKLTSPFYSGWFNFTAFLLLFSYLAKPTIFQPKTM